MTTASRDEPEAVSVPSDVESPVAKLVYLCLRVEGGQTADDLQRRTNMTKLSIHGTLRTLQSMGLVRNDDGQYYVTR